MQEYNSEEISEIAKALINVQSQLQSATKDADNPFTKSKYATLDSVMDSCRDALLYGRKPPARREGLKSLKLCLCYKNSF